MQKQITRWLMLALCLAFTSQTWAQYAMPAPQALPWTPSFSTWTGSTTTYTAGPAGFGIFHNGIAPVTTTAEASWSTYTYYTAAGGGAGTGTTTGNNWYDCKLKPGTIDSKANDWGFVFGVQTLFNSNITLTVRIGDVTNPYNASTNNTQEAVYIAYRHGAHGATTLVQPAIYLQGTTSYAVSGDTSLHDVYNVNVTLPSACNNLDSLYVIFVPVDSLGQTGGAYSTKRPLISFENFKVTGTPTPAIAASTLSPNSVAVTASAGASVSVPFTYGPTSSFSTGTFTAKLSNASGSFASATTIGSVATNSSGSQTISATIPAGTTAGTGYLVEVTNGTYTSGTQALTITNPTITVSSISTSTACITSTTSVPVKVVFTYSPVSAFPNGSTFTANLSDASGSFTSPTTSGTFTSNASGKDSITLTIPTTAISSTGYQIDVTNSTFTSATRQITINNSPGNVSSIYACGSNQKATIEWGSPTGCYTDSVIVVVSTSSLSAGPSGTGASYTVNSIYGQGSSIGGGSVVYRGSGVTPIVYVTGLTNGQVYIATVFTSYQGVWSSGTTMNFTPHVLTPGETLCEGDIVILGMQTQNGAQANGQAVQDVLYFTNLVDLPANTKIHLTNNYWYGTNLSTTNNASGKYTSNGNSITTRGDNVWTSPNYILPAGTVIYQTSYLGTNSPPGSLTLAGQTYANTFQTNVGSIIGYYTAKLVSLTTSGEHSFIYQGDTGVGNQHFLYSLSECPYVSAATALGANKDLTALPSTLALGATGISMNQDYSTTLATGALNSVCVNEVYSGTMIGSRETILKSMAVGAANGGAGVATAPTTGQAFAQKPPHWIGSNAGAVYNTSNGGLFGTCTGNANYAEGECIFPYNDASYVANPNEGNAQMPGGNWQFAITPDCAPTGLTATGGTYSIALNWTAPAGDVLPTNYLIRVSSVSLASISDPTDSTSYSSATDINIAATGVTSYTLTGLNATTKYYVKIYPYNAGYAYNGSAIYAYNRSNVQVDSAIALFPTTSQNSDIISTPTFSYTNQLPYISNTQSSVTNSNQAVWGITIRDGGGVPDADTTPTVLTGLTLNVANSSALQALGLFDASGNLVASSNVSGSTVTFSGFRYTTPDDSSRKLTLRATFKTIQTDNTQLSFNITAATVDYNESGLAQTNGGGAASLTAGGQNTIDVAATKFVFTQQPLSTPYSVSGYTPSYTPQAVVIAAEDANGNIDATFNSSVTLTAANTTFGSGAITTRTATFGTDTFKYIYYTQVDTNNTATLTATGGGLSSASSTFKVWNYAELIVPQITSSKTQGSPNLNDNATLEGYLIQMVQLQPNTAYDMEVGMAANTDGQYIAGNVWDPTAKTITTGNATLSKYFTTDANGNSGPLWIYTSLTGNNTHYAPGFSYSLHFSALPHGSTFNTTIATYSGSKTTEAMDVKVTGYNGVAGNNPASVAASFIAGTTYCNVQGKHILLYDSTAAYGQPMFSYLAGPSSVYNYGNTSSPNDNLPALIDSIYLNAASTPNMFAAIWPVTNTKGVRRIEVRNADNTLYTAWTSATGIWPNGGNTTSLTRGGLVQIGSGSPVLTSATLTALANSGCTGTTVTLNGSYSGGTTPWTYAYKGTGVINVNAASTSVLLSGTKAHDTLTVTDGLGCTAIGTDTITVVPAVSITTQPVNNAFCYGNSANFNVVAANASAYQWQDSTIGGWNNVTASAIFSGVTTATLTVNTPATTYSGYRFRCVVSGNTPCGAVTSNSASLTVHAIPTVKFSPYSTLSVCTAPVSLPVTLTGATPFTFVYNDGSNHTIAGATASYSLNVNPTTSTTYHIRSLSDNNGCVATVIGSSAASYADSTRSVTVFAPVGGSVTPAMSTVCNGNNQTFSLVGGTGTSIQWQYSTNAAASTGSWINFGSTNTTSATLNNVTGTTYVRAVDSIPGCVSVSSSDAMVNVNASSITVTTSNISSSAATISWTAALGATGYTITYNGNTVTTSNTTYNLTGLNSCTAYSVSVVANSTNCSGSPLSGSTTFNTSTGNLTLTLTQGATYKVTASWTAGVGPYKLYLGSIDNLNSLQVFNVTGTSYTTSNAWPGYTVAAYVVDMGSTCTPMAQSAIQQINVAGGSCTIGAPVITARAATANTFTLQWSGSSSGYQFYYKNINGSGSWYSYFTAGNGMTINGLAPGNCYAVYVQNVCGNTRGYTTAVDTICTAAVCSAPLNLILSKATCKGFTATWNNVAGATAYQVFMTMTSASGNPITYSYNVTGSPYTVAIFGRGVPVSVYVKTVNCNGSNGVSAASNVESITTLSTGCKDGAENNGAIVNTTANSSFSIYPNPNNGTFKLEMNTLSTNTTGTLEVMDVLGRTLYTQEVANNNGSIVETVDMGNSVASGLYMVRVRCGNDTHVTKLQIQR